MVHGLLNGASLGFVEPLYGVIRFCRAESRAKISRIDPEP